jgi:hypothetical protein
MAATFIRGAMHRLLGRQLGGEAGRVRGVQGVDGGIDGVPLDKLAFAPRVAAADVAPEVPALAVPGAD